MRTLWIALVFTFLASPSVMADQSNELEAFADATDKIVENIDLGYPSLVLSMGHLRYLPDQLREAGHLIEFAFSPPQGLNRDNFSPRGLANIRNLDGLVNLEHLRLHLSSSADISIISGLKQLRELGLTGARVDICSAVSSEQPLERILFKVERARSFDCLYDIPSLEILSIDGLEDCRVLDSSALISSNISHLFVYGCSEDSIEEVSVSLTANFDVSLGDDILPFSAARKN